VGAVAEIDVVGDRIPGVVDANKQEQKRSGGNAKHGLREVAESRMRRNRKRDVSGERQGPVENPIFKLRLVQSLCQHAADYNDLVSEPDDANEIPENRRYENSVPWRAGDRGKQEDDAEVDNRWRRERVARLCLHLAARHRQVGDEGDYDEL